MDALDLSGSGPEVQGIRVQERPEGGSSADKLLLVLLLLLRLEHRPGTATPGQACTCKITQAERRRMPPKVQIWDTGECYLLSVCSGITWTRTKSKH